VVGPVSAVNSLVGTAVNDQVAGFGMDSGSGIVALTNGNYVVGSPDWNGKLGAATWGSGTTGVSGSISAANSLIGTTAGDLVAGSSNSGGGGIATLTNGNYVVTS